MFSYFPQHLHPEEIEIIIRRHRLDDLTRRIATNDFEDNDQDIRSPSPEPIYDKFGQRLNPRESRTKQKYLLEKSKLIEDLLSIDPSFKPPPDYTPSKKVKKIYLPTIETPGFSY